MARILLVEDDPDVRMVMEHVLIDAGHEVEVCGMMAVGLRLLDRRAYDLVIADGKLPDGTGIAVADRACAAGMKTLVITAYAFTLPAPARDRYDILLKPLRPAELVAAVAAVLADPEN